MLATPFTELVGCTVPIQLAPTGGLDGAPLTAAVSEAGGLGMFPTSGLAAPLLAEILDRLVNQTSRPVGAVRRVQLAATIVRALSEEAGRLLDRWGGPARKT
jgi:NAD(P)H-dependent flavin oxidoreductase YrpB (nitropropane dioxygenase family)